MRTSSLLVALQLLKKARKLAEVNNWFYHHPEFLNQIGVITGDVAIRELKQVAKGQIGAGDYASAMATLRKLNDLVPDSFYDYNSYELIRLGELKARVTRLANKVN